MAYAILWIVVYVLGMLSCIVFQKCVGVWSDWNTERNVCFTIFWPLFYVGLLFAIAGVQLNRLSDVIVAKVCPNAKS